MSDDRGPVFRKPRAHQDRDVFVSKATPASGVPEFQCEDVTGRYEGEELARARARRPTPDRLRILEPKVDRLEKDISDIKVAVADIKGDQKAAATSLRAIERALERADQRDDVEFAAKVRDETDAKKAKREAVIRVVLYVITGGLLGKILHTLGML